MTQLTDRQKFDLVAPVAIYHRADVLYQKRAASAIRELRRFGYEVPDLDDADAWAKEEYDRLFESIVDTEVDGWTWKWDRWGAKAYYNEADQLVFSGDDSWCFPWYADSAALVERIKEAEAGLVNA